MLELLQSLIAYKYACKLKHWQSSNYGMHLLYDRLIENVDGWVDDIAERSIWPQALPGSLTGIFFAPS